MWDPLESVKEDIIGQDPEVSDHTLKTIQVSTRNKNKTRHIS